LPARSFTIIIKRKGLREEANIFAKNLTSLVSDTGPEFNRAAIGENTDTNNDYSLFIFIFNFNFLERDVVDETMHRRYIPIRLTIRNIDER